MSNKQQLAILISKLFQATQTSERQLLEHQLKTLGKSSNSKSNKQDSLMMLFVEENFDQHVQNVVALLYETEDQEIMKVKQSVGVYIRNFVREFLSKLGADELIPSSLQGLMNVFYTVIVSPIVEVPVKRHIYLVFEQLLQIYLSVEENQESITAFYSQLFNHSVL
jgi:hypothetical protein